MVFLLCLTQIEGEFETIDIHGDIGHGIDATFVENEGVVAAVGDGVVVINHGFVGIGHGDILVCKGPAGRLYASLGGGRSGVTVEVV